MGIIKDLTDLVKELLERRESRKQREQKLLLLQKMREAQETHPAALHFSEQYLFALTGIPQNELSARLYELEQEGMVIRFLDGYVLRER